MKLKCIGGAKNGTIHEIDNYYGEHDIIPIMGTIEFRIVDFEDEVKAFRENRIPDQMINPVHRYKISILRMQGNINVKFLIPENWRIEDALHFAFGT